MAKEKKVYDKFRVVLTVKGNNNRELRDKVIHAFLKEEGGYWKDEVKHIIQTRYDVETLADGRKVYLLRPAHLNKGMDFQVVVEGFMKFKNGNDKPPSHSDIIADLRGKFKEDKTKFNQLLKLIDRVWHCEEPEIVLKDKIPTFKSGAPVELILKTLKWLFIEQDMTYWSYDGRGMLWLAIQKSFQNS